MSDQIAALKPGQMIQCTLKAAPRNHGAVTTLERLMRLDPVVKRGLKRAHRKRIQTLNVYIRGNRDWTSRVKCGKLVRPEAGKSWTMRFDLSLAGDLRSVQDLLTVKPA